MSSTHKKASSAQFTKIFHSIRNSSIWDEDHATRIAWITLLTMANEYGEIETSIGGLAAQARITKAEARSAIDKFLAPDPDTITQDFEGRRLVVIENGYRLLNYEKYRNREDEFQRRRIDRERKQEQRERERAAREVRDMSRGVPGNPRAAREVRDMSRGVPGNPTSDQIRSDQRSQRSQSVDLRSTPASPAQLSMVPEPKKPRRPPTGDHAAAVAAFDRAYRDAYGTAPTWGAKQGALIAGLLKAHGLAEVERRIKILFTAAPAFLTGPHDVGTLVQHFDKLAAPSGSPARRGGAGPIDYRFFLASAEADEREERERLLAAGGSE